jgi:hypothetical protein
MFLEAFENFYAVVREIGKPFTFEENVLEGK